MILWICIPIVIFFLKFPIIIDGAVLEKPDLVGGVLFCMSPGFGKGYFAILLDNQLVFEAKLLSAIFALETTQQFYWDRL